MIIEDSFAQNDPEWHFARLYSVGGTGVSKIITTKGERAKSRQDYLYSKASQRLTEKTKPIFQTYEMRWGHEHEPEARDIFSFNKGVEVKTCAMIFADEDKNFHVSPDGYMDGDELAGLEIKCPQLKAYDKYVTAGVLPTEFILQVQSSMAVTGFANWYFMVYFPGLAPMILDIPRDEELIRLIQVEIKLFNRDLEKLIKKLKGE